MQSIVALVFDTGNYSLCTSPYTFPHSLGKPRDPEVFDCNSATGNSSPATPGRHPWTAWRTIDTAVLGRTFSVELMVRSRRVRRCGSLLSS